MKTFYLTLTVSILLLVTGFVLPPTGVIDGSVLSAVGLLALFAAIAQIPSVMEYAKEGRHIKLSKGDFTAEVSGPDQNSPDVQT